MLLTNSIGSFPQVSHTGIYDSNILCSECDGAIGVFDKHVAERMLRIEGKSVRMNDTIVPCKEYNADPETVARFALSLAWRSSLASHRFFSRVDLGPYRDKIARVIQGEDLSKAGAEIFVAEFDLHDVPFLNPHYSRFDNLRTLLIYVRRFIFYIKLDKRPLPGHLRMLSLRKGNPMRTFIRDWRDSKERSLLQKVVGDRARPSIFSRR